MVSTHLSQSIANGAKISPYALVGFTKDALYSKKKSVYDVTAAEWKEAICKHLGCGMEAFTIGVNRNRWLVYARHLFMYLLCTYSIKSLKNVKALLGGKHLTQHTTVMYGRNKIAGYVHVKDSKTMHDLESIIKIATNEN